MGDRNRAEVTRRQFRLIGISMASGNLYLVPTPIGNLEDITFRAVRVLGEAGLIACEDTRQTVKLLNRYNIRKPLLSFFSHNQDRRIPEIIGRLLAGTDVALVSDSGTPGISDPGFFLVVRALEERINVVSLPGPSAAVTALVASGLPADGYVFLGFLKKKPGKMKKELNAAAAAGKTIVFYESPHRIAKTLSVCVEAFGPGARAVIARELTKKFEEYIRGTLGVLEERMKAGEPRGEMAVLIYPGKVKGNGEKENEHD